MGNRFRTLLSRLQGSFRFRSLERETEEELQLHIEMLARKYVTEGMSPEGAQWAAMRQFGRKSALTEDLREKRGIPQLDILWREILLAFRQLRTKPSFTISALLTLTIGIGASTTIFAIAYAVLLHSLPYSNPDRLVSLQSLSTRHAAPWNLSYPTFFDFRRENTVFSHLVSFRDDQFTLTDRIPAIQVPVEIVSWDLFPMLGVQLAYGSGFTAQDEAPGTHVAVLAHRLWQDRFGSDPHMVGRTVSINGRGYTVAGIAPKGFHFPPQDPAVQLWVTLADDAVSTQGDPLTAQRGAQVPNAMGRLAPGVSTAHAKAQMDSIANALAKKFPDTNGNIPATVVQSALQTVVGDTKTPILILCGAVALLLIVACANVANLILVRGSERQGEFAMRAALGASKAAVLRQWLSESLALGLLGCGTGLAGAFACLRILPALAGDSIPRLAESAIGWQVVACAIGLMLLTSVAFSLLPALQSFRLNLERILRDGSRSVTGRNTRLRTVLVISQVMLSLTLLTGAEMLMASFLHFVHRNPGFNPAHVFTFNIGLPEAAYPSKEQQIAFAERMLTSLRSLPGVKLAATGMPLPLAGSQMSVSFDIEERRQPPQTRPHSDIAIISPGFFSALQIQLLRGRSFNDHDDVSHAPVVIVNQAFAAKFFPGENVIGKRIEPGATNGKEPTRLREIVGVVANARQVALSPAPDPIYYFPYKQMTWGFGSVILKTAQPPRSLEKAVRGTLARLEAQAPVFNLRTMDDLASTALEQPKFHAYLLSSFAVITLLLTAIGLYGTLAYSVEMRRREFGIRIALGAAPRQLLSAVIRKAALLLSVGLALGTVLSFAAQRLLANLTLVVSHGTPGLLFIGCLILTVTGFLAALLPAFKAASIDPTETLRQE